jgi:hypothetical protein
MDIVENEEREEIVDWKSMRKDKKKVDVLIDSILCCQLAVTLYIYRRLVFHGWVTNSNSYKKKPIWSRIVYLNLFGTKGYVVVVAVVFGPESKVHVIPFLN